MTALQADIAKYAKLTVMFSADRHLSQHLWQQEVARDDGAGRDVGEVRPWQVRNEMMRDNAGQMFFFAWLKYNELH